MFSSHSPWFGFDIFVIETGLVLVALILAFVAPQLGEAFFRRIEEAFTRLARRPFWSLLVIGIAPILLRLLLLPLHTPTPYFHDEYGYLLSADTFAHWRMTNPPHPLRVFFESMHILQQPTYASQYPPSQGLFLAAGQIVTGRPWAGVMLSVGLMCAALLWMLRGWFPPGWAFLGASIAVMRLGLFSYWMNSYWGGAVAAMAGALVAGGYSRLRTRPGISNAILFGLGFILLANSRPYEGFFFSLPFAAAFLWRRTPARVVIALTAVLAVGALATGYYNWRVTGNPFLLPHKLKNDQYGVVADFIFEKPRPEPHYNHAVIRDYYVRLERTYQHTPNSAWDFVAYLVSRQKLTFWFFLGPVLALPLLLTIPCAVKVFFTHRRRILSAALLVMIAGMSLALWVLYPHYHAPACCVIYACLILSMRRLRHGTVRGRPFGLFLTRMIPSICVVMVVVRMLVAPLGIDLINIPLNWANSDLGNFDRGRMLNDLRHRDTKSLVIVRYRNGHNPEDEWVYNAADIDTAKVIWARDMEGGNQPLLDYFRDRQIYLVEPDRDRKHLINLRPPLIVH
jgi:hypothetical protein